MDIIKTYYVLEDVDKFKKNQIVKMEREKARRYMDNGSFMLFHIAFRNGLVKLDAPKKSVKKKRRTKK